MVYGYGVSPELLRDTGIQAILRAGIVFFLEIFDGNEGVRQESDG